MLGSQEKEISDPMSEDEIQQDIDQTTKTTTKHVGTNAIVHTDEIGPFSELLKQYYLRFFPYALFARWLSYNNVTDTYLKNREFSFTLKDDLYIRHQSFNDWTALRDEMRKKCPYKIDIGAVYNAPPNLAKSIKTFKPEEKELVFDIDMTDYDDIRTCCSGAAICKLCWPFMSAAIEVIDSSLCEDFGFNHRLWVYSGRRGVHCWVCDGRARKLNTEQRGAIVQYLSLVTGSDQTVQKVSVSHPVLHFIDRSASILEPYFKEIALKNQKLLQIKKHIEVFLAYIPDKTVSNNLREKWEAQGNVEDHHYSVSTSRWDQLQNTVKKLKKWDIYRREIVLHFTYPRLDVNVSKQTHHLLKSPFSVHPKTGRVCVPFDQRKVKDFDPFDVPTLSDLCRQIDEYKENQENEQDSDDVDAMDSQDGPDAKRRKISDYKMTNLREYVKYFKTFQDNMKADNESVKIKPASLEF